MRNTEPTEMRFLAEEFQCVPFLLQGISIRVGSAVNFDFIGLDFNALSAAHRLGQSSFDSDTCASGNRFEFFIVEFGHVQHNLYVGSARTVVQSHEPNVFVSPAGPDPSFEYYFFTEGVFFQSLGNLDASLDSHNAFVVWIIAVQR